MQHFFVAHLVSVFHLGPFASVDAPYSTTHHFESHPAPAPDHAALDNGVLID
jgi:hypothetical protein